MACAVLIAGLVAAAAGQTKQAFERLEGRWTGSGAVNGQQVRAELDFARVLANRFTQLRYRFVVDGTAATFEGHAYYAACPAAGECRGTWFDSQGATHTLFAVQTAESVTAEWRNGDIARGKTEYRLTDDRTLIVTDWVRAAEGAWRQFGAVRYSRAP
jgi:hypothetical protein